MRGPLPRISLNYGDNGMRTETKGTLSFGLHKEWFMKKEQKQKAIGL